MLSTKSVCMWEVFIRKNWYENDSEYGYPIQKLKFFTDFRTLYAYIEHFSNNYPILYAYIWHGLFFLIIYTFISWYENFIQ